MSTANHGLMVTFYMKESHNAFKSNEAGRAIYDDVEHVNIIIPGDKLTEIDCLADDTHRQKYAVEYAKFKAGEKDVQSGTPLSQWPAMSRSLVKEWNYLNVYTVDQLARLSDTAKQAFGMGANEWVNKAQAFLKLAEDSSVAEKYAVENAKLREEMAELRRMIEAQQPEKRGPGRPPKIREDEAA